MSRTNRQDNPRTANKWRGYYLEDTSCQYCLHYQGKRRGCALDACCCEEEKLEAIRAGRIKRSRDSM